VAPDTPYTDPLDPTFGGRTCLVCFMPSGDAAQDGAVALGNGCVNELAISGRQVKNNRIADDESGPNM
jgi:hypothetical protein